MSLTKRQLEIRRTGLTAGDMRAIVGQDPYGRTKHDVYVSKVIGEPELDDSANLRLRLGNELEPVAIRLLGEKTKLHVHRRDPESLTIRHPERSAHIATPDAFLGPHAFEAPTDLGEVKIVGFRAMDGWGPSGTEEIPDWALVQVTWGMYVARVPRVRVGALIGTEFRHYAIAQDEDLTGVLVEEADKFLRDYITPQRPPPIDGTAGSGRMLRAIFPGVKGPVMRADDEAEARAHAFFKFKAELEEAKGRLEGAKQALMAACGSAEGIMGEGWRLKLGMRQAYTVERQSYTVPEGRVFDMRQTARRGKAAA